MPHRRIELARGAWGVLLLAAPGQVLRRLTTAAPDRRSVAVTRVLGARHLTQAVLSGRSPSPDVLAMGAWVDAAHAATAVGFAAADRARARAALTDAAVAATWAALGARDTGTGAAAPPGHDRVRDRLARAVLRAVPGGAALLRRAARPASG